MPNDGSGFCTLTHTSVKPIFTKMVSRSNFNVFQIKGFGNFNFKTKKIQKQIVWKRTILNRFCPNLTFEDDEFKEDNKALNDQGKGERELMLFCLP